MYPRSTLGISIPPGKAPALTVHLEAEPVHEGSDAGVDARFAPLTAAIAPRGDAVEDKAV